MGKLPFALEFERQYPRPLDPTMTAAYTSNLTTYLANNTRYPGQMIVRRYDDLGGYDCESIYILNNNRTGYNVLFNPIKEFDTYQDILNYALNIVVDENGYEIPVYSPEKERYFLFDKSTKKFYIKCGFDESQEGIVEVLCSGRVGISHVANLQNELNSLQATLDAKALLSHVHTIANITSLQAALDAKALLSHVHTIANITSLQTALDAKAALSHVHTIADITSLQAALDEKASQYNYDLLRLGVGIPTPNLITNIIGNESILVHYGPYKSLTPAQLRDYTINSIGVTQWTQSGANSNLGISWDLKATMNNNNFTIVVRLSHNKLGTAWASTDEVNIYPFGAMTGIAHCKTLECVVNSSSDTGASIGLVGYNLFAAAQNAYPTVMQQCNEVNETAMVVNPNDLYSSSYYSDAGKLPLASTVRLQFKSSPTLHATLANERTRTFYLHGLLLNN